MVMKLYIAFTGSKANAVLGACYVRNAMACHEVTAKRQKPDDLSGRSYTVKS